jgi:quercetin dioxygenase-like cupin family protein
MPVHQEPHHRQVFQSGPMRIIDLQIPPGDMSWFHSHEWPVFYLTVADSQTRTQILGEEWGARGRGAAPGGAAGRGGPPAGAAAPSGAPAAGAAPRAGAPPAGAAPRAGGPPRFRPRLFSDLSYAERAVTHRIHNNGTGLYRALGVINETQGGDEAVTEEAAGFSGKAEMSNRWFRVHRVVLAPGEKTPAHQHKAPVVVLQDSAGKGVASGAMTFEFNEPGQWGFFDNGARHEISNSGTARLELIEVELRRR